MTQFDDREKAFEKKFGLDEEFDFRVSVQSARLFGLWAAKQMNMNDADAETYASQVANAAVAKAGHENVLKKVEQDFAGKGVNFTRHRLEKEINDREQDIRRQASAS